MKKFNYSKLKKGYLETLAVNPKSMNICGTGIDYDQEEKIYVIMTNEKVFDAIVSRNKSTEAGKDVGIFKADTANGGEE